MTHGLTQRDKWNLIWGILKMLLNTYMNSSKLIHPCRDSLKGFQQNWNLIYEQSSQHKKLKDQI